MRHLNARAIVLRSRRVGDADRLLDLLTAEHGILTAKARHAAKSKKRFVGSLEPFSLGLFSMTKRQAHWRTWALQQVQIDEPFASIREDLPWYYLACYVCETVLNAAERDHPLPELYGLVLETLGRAGARKGELARVKLCFDLHLLNILGLLPSLGECAHCGKDTETAWIFQAKEGNLYCREHGENLGGPSMVLSPGSFRLLNRFVLENFTLAERVSWSARQRAECLRLSRSIFDHHVPRRTKSYLFLKPFLEGKGGGEELPKAKKYSPL